MLKANVQELLSRIVVDRSSGILHCHIRGRALHIEFALGKIVRVVSNLGFHSNAAALAQSGHLTWSHFDALWARGEADGRMSIALEEMGISKNESDVARDKLLCRQALTSADEIQFEVRSIEGDERFPTEPFLSSIGVPISRSALASTSATTSQQTLILMADGEALLRKRDFGAASECFRKAYELGHSGAALGAQAWATYIDPNRKAEQTQAKLLMQQAIDLDASVDQLHYHFGVMCRLEGDFELATRHFKLALGLNAAHLEAAQELRSIELRKKPQLDEAPKHSEGLL